MIVTRRCEICSKSFATISVMKRHIRVCHGKNKKFRHCLCKHKNFFNKFFFLKYIPKDSIFFVGSNLFSFIFPTSTTKTQSSIVMEVSARLVLITIFLCLVLQKIKDCSSLLRLECKGKSLHLEIL